MTINITKDHIKQSVALAALGLFVAHYAYLLSSSIKIAQINQSTIAMEIQH